MRFSKYLILAGASTLTIAMVPSTALAQDSAPTAENSADQDAIIVTGSRFRRDPLEQDAPVVFVDRSDIERTGLSSIADVLQRLPSSGGGLNSKFNNSGNFGNPPDGGGVGAGAAEVDLRYLGSKRTLVLVDGLRWVNGASASGVPGSTDLNTIPEALIERVEVLQDGASSVYGSDAIAGVVNIITKSGQDGLQVSAQHGLFEQGDGFTQNYSASWGNGKDGPTRIIVGGNYVKQGSVMAGDRSISQFPTPGATACDSSCSSGTPLGRFIVLGNDLTLRGPVIGRDTIYNPLDPTSSASDFKAFTNADRFNFAPYNYIQTPLERYGAFAALNQELGSVNLKAKVVYNRRNSKNQAAPLPLFIGPDAGNGNLLDRISIDATNPYNPFGTTLESGFNLDGTPNGNAANYAFIGRRFVENGPRRYNQKVNTIYASATLDGAFDIGGKKWYWDVNGLYGKNKAKQTMYGNVHAGNLAVALGPLATCQATAGCVPFNVFGGAGSITPDMIDYVTFDQRDSSSQRLWDISANISGSLFALPGGDLGIALGAEHRNQTGRFDPDPVVAAGLGADIPALPTKGGYAVNEFYGELNAPLFKDVPFAELLELSFAARHSNYNIKNSSKSFSATTMKAGANWKPFADLRIRGGWGQGFRAPSIGELFGTPSRFDQEVDDPCSGMTASTPADVRTNCVADGVPGDNSYVQNNSQISVVTGGNEDLRAEKSKGWNVGAVYSPSWAPRLSLEGNYYNFKVKGAIQSIDAATLLGRCALNGDALSCAAVNRTASGQISQINGVLQNIGGIKTSGIDATVNYRSPDMGGGTFGVYWSNNWLLDYTLTVPATNGTTKIKREGTEQGSPDQAFPKYKSTAVLDWTADQWAVSLTGRYISKVVETQNANSKMGSRFYTDMQLRWMPELAGSKSFGFALGVNNLFDKDPPACFSCGLNNMDATTYDVPGRYWYLRVNFGI